MSQNELKNELSIPMPVVGGRGIFLPYGLSPDEIRQRLKDQQPADVTDEAWQQQVESIVSAATRKD